MACINQILNTINNSIDGILPNRDSVMSKQAAESIRDSINTMWSSPISKIMQYSSDGGWKIVIGDLTSAVNKEYKKQLGAEAQFERDLDFFNGDQALLDQETADNLFGISTKPGELEFHINTINVISKFLENVGVQQRLVYEMLAQDGTVVEGAIAAANFIQGTVDILDDINTRPEAWNKLPEEAAHFWYRLLDGNSELKDALLQASSTTYRVEELNNSLYGKAYGAQLTGNSIDLNNPGKYTLSPLREEAIGQLIAEAIKRIETNNGSPKDYSFLEKFIKWINSLIDAFRGIENDPFEVAAMKILSSDMSDLLTWDEYYAINNVVNFTDVLSEQSVKPIDYSLLSDLGWISNSVEGVAPMKWVDKVNHDNTSPLFNSQEELDEWMWNNYGPEIIERQKKVYQEVLDNEAFFTKLITGAFRKKSRYLPKTIKKYYSIVDGGGGIWDVQPLVIPQSSLTVTEKLNPTEKDFLINNRNYINITPTLKVLPNILKKYNKQPIALTQPITIDGAKKQELNVLNSIRELIVNENPGKKSISTEEFVHEVHNWLEMNYVLGFANEDQYLSYRTDQTFKYLNNPIKDNRLVDLGIYTEREDPQDLTDEQIQQMPLEERQRLAAVLGLTKQNPSVYHNKVSLRFNDSYHGHSGHFTFAPSAWGNLTYFYTGNNEYKDAVLLHEIQNDNIERLKAFKVEKENLDDIVANYIIATQEKIERNISMIEKGSKRIHKNYVNSGRSYNTLNEILNSASLNVMSFDSFKLNLQESIDLHASNLEANNPEKKNELVQETYLNIMRWKDFMNRGGIKSLLTKEDLKELSTILKESNVDYIQTPPTYLAGENQYEPGIEINASLNDRKDIFSTASSTMVLKINHLLKQKYGVLPVDFKFSVQGKSRTRREIRQGVLPSHLKLNENINWLLITSEQKTLSNLYQTLNERKKAFVVARNRTNLYEFNKKLKGLTVSQYNELVANYKYNKELKEKLIDSYSQADLKNATAANLDENYILNKIENERDTFEALKEMAIASKIAIEQKYQNLDEEISQTLEVELNYFTPLIHHLLQKHIKQFGKDFPMYFSGFNITKLTQGNTRTALIYAGKDEVIFTEAEAKEIKKQAAIQIGMSLDGVQITQETSVEEAIKALNVYKKIDQYNLSRVIDTILNISYNKPIETGAIYNALSQINGIKLIWEPSIEGLVGNPGGYRVDLTDYNYDVPILYGIKQPVASDVESSVPKVELPNKVKSVINDFLKRIGVDVQGVKEIVVDGIKLDANAIAHLTQSLVQVVEGKEAQSLPEEAMHFAVAIIKQTNPTLYLQLLKEINGYEILKETFAQYSTNPLYQTKDGKPDVLKIKEEAIGKLLAAVITNNVEPTVESTAAIVKIQNLWTKILDYLKSLFNTSGFDQLSMDIVSGKNIGTAADIDENETSFLQTNDRQNQIFTSIKNLSDKITKDSDEEGYFINGKKITRRVSDIISSWYERKFRDKDLTKSEYQKAVDNLKAEKGTAGHADIEHAFSLFVDSEGKLRDVTLNDDSYESKLSPENRDLYEILKENLKQRFNSFPAGTRFMTEVKIYDASRDMAGTVDFLAITPEGKVSILDWKFMDLNTDRYTDIPWYKVNAWNKQMEQYRYIISKTYGVKNQEFDQTMMIPIKAYYSQGNVKENILPRLLNVKIGDVNIKNIEDDYLIPVGLESQKTGIKKIDVLLEKLNAIYKRLSDQKVPVEEKINKAEQLNALFYAIRQLQMKQNIIPLLNQAKTLNKQIQNILEKYEEDFKGKDPSSFTDEEISDFSEILETARESLQTYLNLTNDLKPLFQDDQELLAEVREVVDNARDFNDLLIDIDEEFTTTFIGGTSTPEKIIKGISRIFGTTATIQLKGLETLYKKANKAFAFSGMDTLKEVKRLEEIKNAYQKWANAKGLSAKNQFNIIKKADKNELIDEFNPEFYKSLRKAIEEQDFKWIRDNVDGVAYKEFLKELKEEEYKRILSKVRVGTEEQNAEDIIREKSKANDLYNISTLTSVGWLLYDNISKFPNKEIWTSKDWKTLHLPENKPALDFYQYIIERNNYYKSIGYINAKQARTFLPWVRKGLSEKLIFGGELSIGEQFLRSISVDEGDTGYGKIDPLTGKPVNTIPIYLTSELDDYSTDLFKTMAMYNEFAIKFKYLSDIEAQGRALIRLEKNKKAIATSIFGKTDYKDGVMRLNPDNSENTKLVEDMVKAIIYQQKYIESETFDQLLGRLGNFGGKLNEKLGYKIFPDNLEGRQISVNKIITQMNNTFQVNALGLNVLSSMSNLFGGKTQSFINSGKYFTKTDYVSTELWLLAHKMGGEDKRKMLSALDYFLPFTENYNRDAARQLSLNKLDEQAVQDFLMQLMRRSDRAVQVTNFFVFLKNSIIVDDKIVNTREYLRSTPEFQNFYSGTKEERSLKNEKFEKAVIALNEEKGVLALSSVNNKGELIIPGVDQKSESVVEFRRKVQGFTADALGSMSDENKRIMNMTVYGNSLMIFKNWIPRLVDVRMGNLKYNSSFDAYEWGRTRMVFRVISEDFLGAINNLYNSIQGNDKGIKFIKDLYDKKKTDYEKDTGKELNMNEDEFINLVRQNITNQLYDVLVYAGLFALALGLKALPEDDEEDESVKNQYKFLLKATDKFRDEIGYFYDPTSIAQLFGKGIFPSLGLLENYSKVLKNFMIENYAIVIGDEELQEKNKVIKYVMKSFPVSSQAASLLPMFYPTLAKDLGIRMQSQYGIR